MVLARVLIATSDPDLALRVQEGLQPMGPVAIGRASTGDGAVQQVRETSPDLVFCDQDLDGPGRGEETIRRIAEGLGVPVISLLRDMAGRSQDGIGRAWGCLPKPPDPVQVIVAVDMVLRRRQSEEAGRRTLAQNEMRSNELAAELYEVRKSVTQLTEERDKSEAARDESERRCRRITEAVTDYVFRVRCERGRPVETIHSPNCLAVTGYLPEEFSKDPTLWIRMVVAEDRPLVQRQIARLMSGQGPQWIEHRIIRKDGAIRWVRNTSVPLYDAQGKLLSYEGLIRDITERKQVQEALRGSDERFRLAISGAREGLWDWHTETGRLYVTSQGRSLLGEGEDERATYSLDEAMARVHGEDMDRVRQVLLDHIAGRTPHFECEFRCRHVDGTYRWILARGIAIRERQGNVGRMAGTLTDTTLRKEEFRHEVLEPLQRLAEHGDLGKSMALPPKAPSPDHELQAVGDYLRALMSEMRDARTHLQESRARLLMSEQLASVGRLAASIAHEVRNPLTSLKMRFYSLQSALGTDPETEEDFQVISEEIARLESIVGDFLEFSRPREPRLTPQDVRTIVDRTVVTLGPQMEAQTIRLTVEHDPDLPLVLADADQLKQVFINLLRNAIEAVSERGEIRISTRREERPDGRETVAIRFRDNGPGVPDSIRPRLFEPFVTTRQHGTGLGLCISAQIIEKHGGRILLESSSSDGATFTVTLPAATAPESGPADAQPMPT